MKRRKNRRFTNRGLEALAKPSPGSSSPSDEYTCAQLPRLVAAVFKNGTIAFRVKGKVRGRRISYTFGHYPTWNAEQAIERAKELLRLIDQGIDPRQPLEDKEKVTLCQFVLEHFRPHVEEHYKSAANSINMLKKRILPEFGDRYLQDITKKDIAGFLRTLTKEVSGTTSNRYHALLSSLFKFAIELDLTENNPCRGIKKAPENKSRDRFLHPDEFERFIRVLQEKLDKPPFQALFLLLCTGARVGELLGSKWSDINLSDGTLYLENPKNGESRYVTLNSVAIELLTRMHRKRRRSCPWVFPSKTSANGHIVDLRRAFKSVCAAAKITNLRIHDLRRSHAVQLLNAGVDHFIIKEILGHKSLKSTQVYARVATSSMAKSSEVAADSIRRAMND